MEIKDYFVQVLIPKRGNRKEKTFDYPTNVPIPQIGKSFSFNGLRLKVIDLQHVVNTNEDDALTTIITEEILL